MTTEEERDAYRSIVEAMADSMADLARTALAKEAVLRRLMARVDEGNFRDFEVPK